MQTRIINKMEIMKVIYFCVVRYQTTHGPVLAWGLGVDDHCYNVHILFPSGLCHLVIITTNKTEVNPCILSLFKKILYQQWLPAQNCQYFSAVQTIGYCRVRQHIHIGNVCPLGTCIYIYVCTTSWQRELSGQIQCLLTLQCITAKNKAIQCGIVGMYSKA